MTDEAAPHASPPTASIPVPPLVSTEWLAAHLHDRLPGDGPTRPALIVFDASFYLPTEAQNAAALFEEAHIEGARFFDLDEVADQETDLPHMAPTAGRFARLMAELGVSNDSHLVFYDQKGLFSAARGWWLMRLFGHDRASVLDGGLPKWRSEGRTLHSGRAAPAAPGHFQPRLRSAKLRGLGDMLALDGLELVLDARPAGRFNGTAPEPRPGLPSGSIPGSRSLPASELLAPDQTMLGRKALLARFASSGVDGTKPVVTSCGTGVTAAILTLGLAVAGLPEGALYDGSWTEWAGLLHTSLPPTPKDTSRQ